METPWRRSGQRSGLGYCLRHVASDAARVAERVGRADDDAGGGGNNGGGDDDAGGNNGGGDDDAGGGGNNGGGDDDAGGGGDNGGGCVDLDGDGYGQGCEAGVDCDDGNPNFGFQCPDCSKFLLPGCPCSGGQVPCYSGSAGQIGVGACTTGVQKCADGYWQQCVGDLLPDSESCDGKDNDCDGETDEGVLSSCGNCDLSCIQAGVGPGGGGFLPGGEGTDGVGIDGNGWLVLDPGKAMIDLNHIWISNSGEGTVSKLDTKTGFEVARYKTCGDPSRTAVDLNGDVWVGCRNGAAVAKIITDVKSCTDKNKNGNIDTSYDANGDHKISGNEMLPSGQDECIKFVVKPPGVKMVRAMGVDKENHGWAGDWVLKRLWRLSPSDGAVVQSIDLGCNPYGIVVDQKGIVWISGRGCASLLRVDPADGKVQTFKASSVYEPYGINLDIFGNIWTGNCCSHHAAYRFDPTTQKFDFVPVFARPRGLATSIDGFVYVANDQTNSVARVNAVTMKNEGQISLGGGRFPIGMAIDYDGYVWAVNQQASTASKIDPKNLKVIGEYPTGKSPYTYSDMTGYTLHNFTAQKGHYRAVFGVLHQSGQVAPEADPPVLWESIAADVEVPASAAIYVRYRVGDSIGALAVANWTAQIGPFPPETFPIDLVGKQVIGRLIEVELFLQANWQKQSPIVKSLDVKGKILN